MSIQFLGMIGHRLSSETIAPVGPIFDRDYIVRFAQTHEAAGFDRLLVGHWSDQPDGFLVTALAGRVVPRRRPLNFFADHSASRCPFISLLVQSCITKLS